MLTTVAQPFTVFQRAAAWANLVVPLWFTAVYVLMSGRRPEYSHLTDAISELGSLDAPDLWVWNTLGYIVPGLVFACLGIALQRVFSARPLRNRIAGCGLVAFGLLMTLSGVFPANMANFSSTTTQLHIVGSFGAFFAFLVAGFAYPRLFDENPGWKWISNPSRVLVWLSIASGLLRFWGNVPGLGQRVTFAIVFLWIMLVSFALLRSMQHNATSALPGDSFK